MAKKRKTNGNNTQLNIPSFLMNPTSREDEPAEETARPAEKATQPPAIKKPVNDRPQEDVPQEEVDAVMQTVMAAAGLAEEVADSAASTSSKGSDAASGESQPTGDTSDENQVPDPVTATPESQGAAAANTEPEPSLEDDLALLNTVERRLYAHRYASSEIQTFGETIDPPKASADRAEVLSVLVEEDHELLSRPDVDSMVRRLNAKTDQLEPVVAAQVRALTRDRKRLVSVSASDQAKLVRLQSESYDAWLAAKANNDWRSFAPYLDRLVNMQRKIAKAMNPNADPYDTLLDEYEPGANRAFYNSFFARIKRSIVPLLSSISMSGRTLSNACVQGRFDEARQWELARDIAQLEGIDEEAHFLTSTEHPFSDAMTSNYAVTAGHVYADDLMSNVYTILHEVGHNLYEQGVDPKFNRTSLKGGTSMGMHEAQSRFFENYIGRDRAFIGPLLDLMKRRFPGQLSRVTPNQLYRAVNRVSPTLIRTEADELTYPLHIIVRYEIEQLLLDGKATAREVPKLWAERYHRYIGATVPNDTEGALQDVHWAWGSFGYFPTYALGGAYAAQLRAKMIADGIDWQGCLSAGNLAPIRAWLKEHVWQYGRSKDPADIIKDACGEPFNPRHYANYLTNKYSELYNL